MTCKSNEQRKLAYYVMTQPLLFNCEKKLTENFDVTISQCHIICFSKRFEYLCSMWKHVCKLDVQIGEEKREQNKKNVK